MNEIIGSKKAYLRFINEDKKALGISKKHPSFFSDEIWKFQLLLRKVEYYRNCKTGFLSRLLFFYYLWKFHNESLRLGFTIPINCIGPGLAIVHHGTIVITNKCKIGSHCRIHTCVNIGMDHDAKTGPRLGDNIYIAPGVKIFGDITLADGIAIGANAVVNKSFEEPNISIAGIPAKKISDNGAERYLF